MVTFDTLLRELRGKTPEIEPAVLATALRENGKRPALIDVREPDEHAQGMIPGTLHIPRGVKHIVHNRGWEPVTYIASFSASFRGTIFEDPRASQKPEDFMY